jgi:hypothetical protein
MELHPLDPLGLARPDPVDSGWARRISQGPRSVEEVLRAASAAMDAEDEAEAYRRDPIGYITAQRARTTLWGRLFGRR